jgi:hypothetical protein
VIFTNRCNGSNSAKYIAALAHRLNTSANAQDHEEQKKKEKIFHGREESKRSGLHLSH